MRYVNYRCDYSCNNIDRPDARRRAAAEIAYLAPRPPPRLVRDQQRQLLQAWREGREGCSDADHLWAAQRLAYNQALDALDAAAREQLFFQTLTLFTVYVILLLKLTLVLLLRT